MQDQARSCSMTALPACSVRVRTLGVTPAGYFEAVVHWMPTLLLTVHA